MSDQDRYDESSMPSANTPSVASSRLRNASRESAEKSSRMYVMSRVPMRRSPATMGMVRLEVLAPADRFSSPSTPRIVYSLGPFFFVTVRSTRLPTFCGSVEACTSSEVSTIEMSLTPSWRSFCAYWSRMGLGSSAATAAGCAAKTSMAVERSSV